MLLGELGLCRSRRLRCRLRMLRRGWWLRWWYRIWLRRWRDRCRLWLWRRWLALGYGWLGLTGLTLGNLRGVLLASSQDLGG